MAFNSYFYFVFLLALTIVYYAMRGSVKWQNRFLVLASYFFYGFWDWRFLSLIIISTATDFIVAQKIEAASQDRTRKLWLYVSLLTNLGILAFFKYFNFFVDSAESLLNYVGFVPDFPTLNIILPVGISFYTFQTLSYTIDVYRSQAKPIDNLLDFSLYVSFFPQLVAGPIERPNDLIPQISNPRRFQISNIVEGSHHILLGLFKKVVIADNMAAIVGGAFAPGAETLSGLENWMALLAFALQIYGDFSGYSSIAQGSAKLIGFDLSYNFHMPYFACSPSDFWQRWHVTLSRWLRDYLYIPLGGNRGGAWFVNRNLMITMVLGGLWHGAGWHFVLWGFYHGSLLAVYKLLPFAERYDRENATTASKLRHLLAVLIMFVFTLLGWLLFRVDNVPQIVAITKSLVFSFEFTGLCFYGFSTILFLAGPLFLYEWYLHINDDDHMLIFRKHWFVRAVLYSYFIVMMILFSVESSHEFIYFQF